MAPHLESKTKIGGCKLPSNYPVYRVPFSPCVVKKINGTKQSNQYNGIDFDEC